MKRRRVLNAAALAAVGLAGCTAPTISGDRTGCPGTAPPPITGGGSNPPADGPIELPVPMDELARGALRDEIPAITEPRFGPDWSGVDASMSPGDLVIGIERSGRARAYPLAVLSRYEVVNDVFDGPLLVTYCPLCASGLTAVRTVMGEETVFGVSGLLYRSNLVLYDRLTDSLWSQLLAQSIRGPETGSSLTLVPSTLTTWRKWRGDYPTSSVLLPPPTSETISYVPEGMPSGVHGHVGVQEVGLSFDDDRLPRTELVLGVSTPELSKAYSVKQVADVGVVNDCVGGLPVMVTGTPLPSAYDRRVAGETLRFEPVGSNRVTGGGSTWDVTTGRAVAGPHEGTSLVRVPGSTTMYWFAWLDFHPETTVYQA